MLPKLVASAVKIIANVVVVVALGLLAYACYRKYHDTGSINSLGLLIVNTVSVAMYIAKRDAAAISRSPALWLLAFAGTCVLASTYGFLQGAWPFGLVEAIWSLVALQRWWRARRHVDEVA